MAMLEAKVGTGGFDDLSRRIGIAVEKIHDSVMRGVADWLHLVIRTSFQDKETAEGVPWEPLSLKYAKRKRGPGILRESGALFEQVNRGPFINGNTITAGSTLPYAAAHQFGFEGDESVRAFVRRIRTGDNIWGMVLNPQLGKMTRRIVKRGEREDKIAEHTRHMRIPARPYLPSPEFVETEGTKIAQGVVDGAIKEAAGE